MHFFPSLPHRHIFCFISLISNSFRSAFIFRQIIDIRTKKKKKEIKKTKRISFQAEDRFFNTFYFIYLFLFFLFFLSLNERNTGIFSEYSERTRNRKPKKKRLTKQRRKKKLKKNSKNYSSLWPDFLILINITKNISDWRSLFFEFSMVFLPPPLLTHTFFYMCAAGWEIME